MSQTQAAAYPCPPPSVSTVPCAYVAPPPVGYPLKDYQSYAQKAVPLETKSRGEGKCHWKCCCASCLSVCVVIAGGLSNAS